MFYYKLLEEKPVPNKEGTIHGKVLSLLASTIPVYGKGIGSAVTSGEIYVLKKLDKKNSIALSNLVYYYFDNKETVRQLLIQSAIDVFLCFEDQFKRVTCNGGQKRAMYKLAKDASHRSFAYFLNTEESKELNREEVTRGVLLGQSKLGTTGQRKGGTVSDNEIKWKTAKIFAKVGVVLENENKFYKNDDTNTKKYRHRRLFSWEIPDDIKNTWQEDEGHEINYVLEMSDKYVAGVNEYVMSKNAFEEAQLERQTYYDSLIKDNEEKHQQLLETIDKTLLNIKDSYTEIAASNNSQIKLIEEIKDSQTEAVVSQEKIHLKLDEIHQDVIVTKQSQTVIIEKMPEIEHQLVTITESQKELQKKTEDVDIDKIASAANDRLKKNVSREINKVNDNIKRELSKANDNLKENVNKTVKKLKGRIRF